MKEESVSAVTSACIKLVLQRASNGGHWADGAEGKDGKATSWCGKALPPWRCSFLKSDLHVSVCLYHAGVFPATFADVIYRVTHISSGLNPLGAGTLHLNSNLILSPRLFCAALWWQDILYIYMCVPMHIISPWINETVYRLIHDINILITCVYKILHILNELNANAMWCDCASGNQ